MTTHLLDPRRSEIWQVDLNPTIGAEMQKVRPAIVVSSDAVRKLPLRLVVPVTGWQDRFAAAFWMVRIEPDDRNGFSKTSAADGLQIRGLSLDRFKKKVGFLSTILMEEVATAIAAVTQYI